MFVPALPDVSDGPDEGAVEGMGPFTVRDGLASGLTLRVLNSDQYLRPTRGVRSAAPLPSLAVRAAAFLKVFPERSSFSHLTATRLHELPLSYAMEADERLHVVRPITQSRIRRADVVGHRAFHPRSITSIDGLPVVDLADTWVDLGELVGRGKPVGLDDLIVVGDAIATRLNGIPLMREALARRVRPRGKATLLEALEEIRVGSASPRETLARLMLMRCGLPEPVLNLPIRSPHGSLLGIGDLVWKELKVIGEYQGAAFHDGEEERKRDDVRRGGLERDGWSVEEIWNADMISTSARHDCVRRFASALGVEESCVNLANAEPRFFSRHAMDLALVREDRRASRWNR